MVAEDFLNIRVIYTVSWRLLTVYGAVNLLRVG